jgi:hypothetical protein
MSSYLLSDQDALMTDQASFSNYYIIRTVSIQTQIFSHLANKDFIHILQTIYHFISSAVIGNGQEMGVQQPVETFLPFITYFPSKNVLLMKIKRAAKSYFGQLCITIPCITYCLSPHPCITYCLSPHHRTIVFVLPPPFQPVEQVTHAFIISPQLSQFVFHFMAKYPRFFDFIRHF